jgi:uncharacterized phage protein gp47/JayE
MAYDYINSNGVIVSDTSEIQDEVTQEYKDNFGSDLVVDNGSTASVLITAETIGRSNLQDTCALIANQINPDIASGKFLDAIWTLTNGQRRQATSTAVTATITGVAGTLIPEGSVAETTNGDRFVSVADVTIPSGGSIDVGFQSEEKGAIPCVAGTLINIADGGVLGWETITNDASGILGLSTQSDAEAREDRKLTLAVGAKALPFAITSGLYAIDDVQSLQFRENYNDTTQVIDGVTMTRNSIWACIDGGTNEEIANALYAYKTIGTGYNNGASADPQEVTITAPDSGQSYTVKFDRPDLINIKIKVIVKAAPSSTNQTQAIKDAILNYANSNIRTEGFKVGNDVSPSEIVAGVASSTGYFVSDCQVTKQSVGVFQRETITIELWEKAVTSNSFIEVILL